MRLYNDYSSYLRARHGSKVYRIALDAGFSCPHRCTYCNEDGSRSSYTNPEHTISEQLSNRIEHLKAAKRAAKFIAYFQAFTNTNSPVDGLKRSYDQILSFKEIVGLSIATRPDCIDTEKLKLISSYNDRYEVWLEYGLQSIHDKTLNAINRGHTFNDFLTAYDETKKFSILMCVHVIIGLPGETRDDIVETARKLTELKVNGVKIHLLHILKGSALEKQFLDGKVGVLTQNEYVDLVCDFLENLSGDIVVQRLTAQGNRSDHIAPAWALDKIGTINKITQTLTGRGSNQGARC